MPDNRRAWPGLSEVCIHFSDSTREALRSARDESTRGASKVRSEGSTALHHDSDRVGAGLRAVTDDSPWYDSNACWEVS